MYTNLLCIEVVSTIYTYIETSCYFFGAVIVKVDSFMLSACAIGIDLASH